MIFHHKNHLVIPPPKNDYGNLPEVALVSLSVGIVGRTGLIGGSPMEPSGCCSCRDPGTLTEAAHRLEGEMFPEKRCQTFEKT